MTEQEWIEMTNQELPVTLSESQFAELWGIYGDGRELPVRMAKLEWYNAGAFAPSNDPTGHARMRQRICAVRARTLQSEMLLARPVTAEITGTCSRCGQVVLRSHLVSSASGPVCPDCYDAASL